MEGIRYQGRRMMGYNFRGGNRDQIALLPQAITDWLPEGHLAWFVIETAESMDLSPFYVKYRTNGQGQAAWHPKMMVALLLYAYCHGERSSRKIEKLCEESVPYRVITGNEKPDHCAISRFRQDNASAMKSLFVEILRLCAVAGLVKAGKVNLDGTKMKANASLSANRTEDALAQEIDRMLAEAEAKDAEEDKAFGKDKRGDELPENLRSRQDRLARLKDAKERLESERLEAEAAQREKLAQRAHKEEEAGKKMRGKEPKSVEDVRKEQEERKANATAPETRILKTRSGYVQGFNAQAVCTDQQIILAADVTAQENDQGLYHPMMEQARENATAVLDGKEARITLGRADAGYCNEADLAKACDHERFVATKKDWKRRKEMRDEPPPRGRIPKHLSATERMERKLRTKRGSGEYRMRSQTIEPVFGQIKSGRGIDSFYGRELVSAQGEWHLICGTNNLLKLFRGMHAGRN
jgi:transposase